MSFEKKKNIEKKERKKLKDSFVKQLIFCVSIVLIFVAIDKICVSLIENSKHKEAVTARKEVINNEVIYGIDNIMFEEEQYNISGWIAWNDLEWDTVTIVLKTLDGKEVLMQRTELFEGHEVENIFSKESSYKSSGFEVTINTDQLEKGICYEVLLDVSYQTVNASAKKISEGTKILTNIYLYNDMVYEYNPVEFEMPIIDDEQWQNVINDGKIYGYSKEFGTWIYLYDNSLFWLVDSTKIPSLEKVPSILVNIYTSEKSLLSEVTQGEFTNGVFGKEIYLNESYLMDSPNSKYYSVSMKLPEGFPITYIMTGPYANRDGIAWVYKANFRFHTLEEIKQWN